MTTLRSDHGGEFVNHHFEEFCNENNITHKFWGLHTPKQIGVAELNIVFQNN